MDTVQATDGRKNNGANFKGRHRQQSTGRLPDIHPDFQRARRRVENYVINLVDEVVMSGVELPMIFLMKLMNDGSKDLLIRMEAAKVLMPYIHKKKPVAIESNSTDLKLTIELTQKQLEGLDDDQLATLTELAKKLAPPRDLGDGAEEASFVEAQEVLPGHGAAEAGALSEAPGLLPGGGDPS